MLDTSQILEALREHRSALVERGVLRLGLFGSFARGVAGPESDVDFVVELQDRTFDTYMNVKLYLEDLLGRRVDLVLFDRIKPRLRERILAEVIDAA